MKKSILLTGLLFALVACGGNTPSKPSTPQDGGNTPAGQYPYNPDASLTQNNDARVPYYGDWVWVAAAADGSKKVYVGVASISVKAKETSSAKNLGAGISVWCADSSCKSVYEAETMGIGTAINNGQAKLGAVAIQDNDSDPRWVMIDDDGKVGKASDGSAQLIGSGYFVSASGTEQVAAIGIEQVSTTPSVKPDGQSQQPSATLLRAVRAAAQRIAIQGHRSISPELLKQFGGLLKK